MKKRYLAFLVVVLTACGTLFGHSVYAASPVSVEQTSIQIDSYEFGPAISKIVLKLDQKVTPAVVHSQTSVTTAGVTRQVTNSYVSDATGHVVYLEDSQYVTLELAVSYNPSETTQNAQPFTFDLNLWRNVWVSSYQVDVTDLSVVAEGDSESQMVASSQDALPNKIVPVLDTFSEKGSVANLQYAAYQAPDSGQSRPLIVWLHGVGEVGTDISMPLLSNEVVALTQDQVQSHFSTFGTQTGADVLVLQSPQAWSASSASSVKAAIDSYLANHPSVDSDRIYLVGASNGAGMVLNMGVTYPNYFAALVPIASGYSYQNTSTEGQESYSLDATTAAALKDQPMWMIHARTDTTYPVDTTILPFYKALLQSGASNKWLSYFETVTGSDFGVEYNGHWSWIYFFNGQVTGVQNTDNAKNSEGLYGMVATDATHGGDAQASSHGMNFSNIFDWMSAQSLTSRAQ